MLSLWMTVRKGKKGYYYDVVVNGVRKRSRCYSTKKEAVAKEIIFLSADPAPKCKTISKLTDEFVLLKKRTWKPSSVSTFIKRYWYVKHFFKDTEVEQLTVKKYILFLEYLDKKGFSNSYKNKIVYCLKEVCKYAEINYGTKTVVPYQVPRYKEKKRTYTVWTKEDFSRFIAEEDSFVYKQFFTFLFFSGCRRGEAMALRFQDIDFEKRKAFIQHSLAHRMKGQPRELTSTKTEAGNRVIPLTEKAFTACLAMREYLYQKGQNNAQNYVFGGQKPLSETSIDRHKDKAIAKAGVPRIRIHDFRHSFVSMLVESGADVSVISKYVGHANITETLNTYTHLFANSLENAIARI